MAEIEKLKALKGLGFKMNRLSLETGLDVGTISKILNGLTIDIKPETKQQLQAAFLVLGEEMKKIAELLLAGKGSED